MEDTFSDDIDSVLSMRRKGTSSSSEVPPADSGMFQRKDPRRGDAPHPGQRIQPDKRIWDKRRPTSRPEPNAIPMPKYAPHGQRPAPSAQNAPQGQRIAQPAQNAPQGHKIAQPAQNAPQGQRIVQPAQNVPQGQRIAQPAQSVPQARGTVQPYRAPQPQKNTAPETPKQPRDPAEGKEKQNVHSLFRRNEEKPKAVKPLPDDDVKVAGKKAEGGKEQTRVTDMNEKIDTSLTRDRVNSKKKKKKKDDDVGGTIVSSLLKTVIYLVSVTVISVVLSIFIINIGNDVFAFVKSDEAVDVTIPENATISDVADILYDNGVINYKAAFKFYGSFKHVEENFVAGDYTVTPMMNYKQLFNAFKEKPVSGTQWVTIPEGYTVDEIIDLMLSYNIGGTKEDYVKAINEGDFSEFWFVKELEQNGYDQNRFYKLEGYLFPDTYEFYNASDAYTVVKKMLKRFDEIYNEKLKTRAQELGMTTDQVVILASMIEKEAGRSSDFRNVSSVFHNRLNNSYTFPCFASDATAVYAIAHERGVRPKEVTAKMMEYDSPYNTYTNAGYPPGAIANPGMNALKYALYPAETSYYYFVSFPSGETVFATNAYEHEQNVARLRAMQEESN